MDDNTKSDTPRNREGEAPTTGAADTEERLRQKQREDVGRANKGRIEERIRDTSAERQIGDLDEGTQARR